MLKQKLSKNFISYFGTVFFNYLFIAVNIVIGFVLIPLIINYLGYEALGYFGLLFSIKTTIDIGIAWIGFSVTKLLIRYSHLKEYIYTFSTIANFTFGLFYILFFSLLGLHNKEYFWASTFFGIGSFLALILTPYYEIFISNLRQLEVAIFRFNQQFLFFIFSIILFLKEKTLDSIFLGWVLANAINFVVVQYFFKKDYKIPYKFDLNILKKLFLRMFRKEISMFINNLSTILLLQIDILLISYLYGKKSAGIYLIAFKIPNTLIMLGWRISEPFQPIVAKGIKENKKEIFKKFKKLEKIVFLVAVIFALGYLLFGETALKIWVGEKNIPNINYMYLIPSLAIFFSILQRLYLSVNFYTKGLNIVSLLQFLEIASKVIFTIFFFDIFKELSPTAGWVFAFFFTIWLYRKNAIRIFNR